MVTPPHHGNGANGSIVMSMSICLSVCCNTLCTSGFVDDVTVGYNGRSGGVTLLRQPAGANTAAAAGYWSHRVPHDVER